METRNTYLFLKKGFEAGIQEHNISSEFRLNFRSCYIGFITSSQSFVIALKFSKITCLGFAKGVLNLVCSSDLQILGRIKGLSGLQSL